MVFLWVLGFLVFLFGSMVVAAVAGAVAAQVCRALLLWIPLSLVTNVVFQVIYLSLVNLARCAWLVEEGDATFWDRYLAVLSKNLDFGVSFGITFGVVGWVWCLKRAGEFTREVRS